MLCMYVHLCMSSISYMIVSDVWMNRIHVYHTISNNIRWMMQQIRMLPYKEHCKIVNEWGMNWSSNFYVRQDSNEKKEKENKTDRINRKPRGGWAQKKQTNHNNKNENQKWEVLKYFVYMFESDKDYKRRGHVQHCHVSYTYTCKRFQKMRKKIDG